MRWIRNESRVRVRVVGDVFISAIRIKNVITLLWYLLEILVHWDGYILRYIFLGDGDSNSQGFAVALGIANDGHCS